MQALGLIETRGLIAAVESADAMLKAADVTLLEKTYVGGGLVSITVTGGVAAVKAAVEAGSAAVNQINTALLVTNHVIPRPHDEVYDLIIPKKPAISSVNQNVGKEEFKPEETKPIESKAEVSKPEQMKPIKSKVEVSKSEQTKPIEPKAEVSRPEEIKSIEKQIEFRPEESKALEPEDLTSIALLPEADNNVNFSHMDLDKINKMSIDNLVLEYDLEKVNNLLARMTVTKLRSLAREYGNLRIAGRNISKANKKTLLAEIKEYYRKNKK